MASKILVKIPTVPFAQVQVNKKGPDVITVSRSNDGIIISPNKDPVLRVAQLEQNIRFLQEQHQSMLTSLHNEIEILRQRNRDLQFQLVFAKTGVIISTPSSPEDDSKPRILLSPKQVNVTPLQIELFEKELGELKISLQEANTKNTYLSAIVDEQKKKIEKFEAEFSQLENEEPSEKENELQQRLDDAERLIRRLRRENEDQRREITSLRSSKYHAEYSQQQQQQQQHHQGNRGSGGNNGRRGTHHRGQRDHRFPPLHSQSYWHQGNSSRGGGGNNSRSSQQRTDYRGGGGDGGNIENDVSSTSGTTLPSLRNGSSPSRESVNYTNTTYNSGNGNGRRSSGYHQGNGNHHYRDGERKYRGQNRGGNKS